MPYIKPRDPPFSGMIRLLRGYRMTGQQLASVLDVSESTAVRRMKNPADLTLADLDRLNRFGHIPLDELREAIGR